MSVDRAASNVPPHRLTNAVVLLHAVYFLIPWEHVSYFPGVGPFKVYVFLFVLLCAAWTVEVIRFGAKKPSPGFAVAALWFWVIFWVGVIHGYIQDDPIKISVPLYQILADAVPYADGMLVWYLIRNNRWARADFEGALKSVFWVALVMGIESILFYYLRIPNPYSLNHEGRFFLGMFARHHIVASRLGLILAGVAFYFFWRRGGWFYLFASFTGILHGIFHMAQGSDFCALPGRIPFDSLFHEIQKTPGRKGEDEVFFRFLSNGIGFPRVHRRFDDGGDEGAGRVP